MGIRRVPPAPAALALTLALALTAPIAPAQAQDHATVVGQVVDSATGRPLAAASVAIGRTEVLTDSAGRFRLPGIGTGGAQLTVRQLGYAPRAVRIAVAPAMAPLALALAPDPLLLQAITVMADRFRVRREKSQFEVSAFERKELATWSNLSLRDFLLYRTGLASGSCPHSDGPTVGSAGGFGSASTLDRGGGPQPTAFGQLGTGRMLCARVRGEWVEPSIWIDDHHAYADELMGYKPGELFLIEVYDRGQTIRAYTTWWVAAMAHRPLMSAVH